MHQKTTDRNRTPVATVRTGPKWYALYPVNHLDAPIMYVFTKKRNADKSYMKSAINKHKQSLFQTSQSH